MCYLLETALTIQEILKHQKHHSSCRHYCSGHLPLAITPNCHSCKSSCSQTDWWDCPVPEQGQTSHPASSALLLLDLQLNSGENFADKIPSFSGGCPLQALAAPWCHSSKHTLLEEALVWNTAWLPHGPKILRNTPKMFKNLKSYRHTFTRKRNSVKACQGCNHERVNLHGRQSME